MRIEFNCPYEFELPKTLPKRIKGELKTIFRRRYSLKELDNFLIRNDVDFVPFYYATTIHDEWDRPTGETGYRVVIRIVPEIY